MASESDGAWSGGPICPNCRQPLRVNLRQERLSPRGASEPEDPGPVLITYCEACGWTLSAVPGATWFAAGGDAESMEVVDPEDEMTLEGQFQLRCRDLITEIRSLGFTPIGWVGMINRVGAARSAVQLLADRRILPVTHWLVDQGNPELTLECEIEQPRWADLFTEAERDEARRRLTIAGGNPGR